MHNKLVRSVLNAFLTDREWTQSDLAQRSGLEETLVSRQLSGQRAIRDRHLVKYLSAFNPTERRDLLGAWLQDHLPADILGDVLKLPDRRLAEPVTEWAPRLADQHRKMLSWWVHHIERDPELREIFEKITAKAGYPRKWA